MSKGEGEQTNPSAAEQLLVSHAHTFISLQSRSWFYISGHYLKITSKIKNSPYQMLKLGTYNLRCTITQHTGLSHYLFNKK